MRDAADRGVAPQASQHAALATALHRPAHTLLETQQSDQTISRLLSESLQLPTVGLPGLRPLHKISSLQGHTRLSDRTERACDCSKILLTGSGFHSRPVFEPAAGHNRPTTTMSPADPSFQTQQGPLQEIGTSLVSHQSVRRQKRGGADFALSGRRSRPPAQPLAHAQQAVAPPPASERRPPLHRRQLVSPRAPLSSVVRASPPLGLTARRRRRLRAA